jgi:hypothetical protein
MLREVLLGEAMHALAFPPLARSRSPRR